MTDKHVESLRVPCLDEGSTPSSSTEVTGETGIAVSPVTSVAAVRSRRRECDRVGRASEEFRQYIIAYSFFSVYLS